MNIKYILFDLDGTLLPMDQDKFVNAYFKLLAKKAAPKGYDPETLVKAIWAGTSAMVKNDGSVTNEEVFWQTFCSIFGKEKFADKPLFDEFYRVEFQNAASSCGFNPEAKKTVDILKSKGFSIFLATNPLFPKTATESRIRWAGLEPSDFMYYTTYENTCHCKPNPKYYEDILSIIKADPSECLMVGNDVTEDMTAESLGMNVFLLTDCLINKNNEDISKYPHGSFKELIAYIEKFPAH